MQVYMFAQQRFKMLVVEFAIDEDPGSTLDNKSACRLLLFCFSAET